MANIQIPNMTPAIALGGTEQQEAVQAGATVRVTIDQIAQYTYTRYPAYLSATSPIVVTGTPTTGATISLDTVTVAYGGTGATSLTLNGVLYGKGTSAVGAVAAGTTGQVLTATTGAAPTWQALAATVTTIGFGTTGLTPSAATSGAVTVAGVLVGANGGTGVANTGKTITLGGNVVTGEALTFSGAFAATFTLSNTTTVTFPVTGTLATLAGAESLTNKKLGSLTTNGVVYTSGGDGTLNSEAALSVARGGTNISSYAVGDLLYASASGVLSKLADVATGSVLTSGGVGVAPAWSAATGVAVTSISFGTTGLTPAAVTQGAVTVAGILVGANGGTSNGFFAVSGPSASLKTFTFPNANATVLTDNAAVTVAQGGTGLQTLTTGNLLVGAGTGNVTFMAPSTAGNHLTSTGSVFQSVAQTGGVLWSAISNGATNAVAGIGYQVNTTSGTATVTLPASPAGGDFIAFCDAVGLFATNALTVARNGKTIQGSATDLTCNVNGQSFGLVFKSSTNDWRVVQI